MQQQPHRIALAFELCTESEGMVSFSRPQDFRVKIARWQYWQGKVEVLAPNGQPVAYEVHAYARKWIGKGDKFEQLEHNEHPTAAEIERLVMDAAASMRGFPIRADDRSEPVAWIDPLDEDDFLDESDDPKDFDFVADDSDEFEDYLDDIDPDLEAEVSEPSLLVEPVNVAGEPVDMPDFGSCCACGKTETVRNLVSLPYLAPVPGTGWGCVICNLPADGAIAVLCDECVEKSPEIIEVCYGYVAEKKRFSVKAISERPFGHDLQKHSGEG